VFSSSSQSLIFFRLSHKKIANDFSYHCSEMNIFEFIQFVNDDLADNFVSTTYYVYYKKYNKKGGYFKFSYDESTCILQLLDIGEEPIIVSNNYKSKRHIFDIDLAYELCYQSTHFPQDNFTFDRIEYD
jgi:hypothetical protein